ncbi:MAG: 50S ribosomal protein L10 [Nanoarchaeota archaeon]
MAKAHVSQAKKEVVKKFKELIKKYPIVGSVNMEGLPTPQLQSMRAQLRDKVDIFMGKKRLMKIALNEVAKEKEGLDKLIDHLKGMPALIFTSENPFTLFKTLQKNKSSAPAKAGQEAPKDVVVPAGPTGFAPGPIISELGGVGIKAGIENGKVIVKEDSKVISAGETFSGKLASLLTRLGIEPMEIGLDLVATYEDGEIFTKDILAVDEQEYIDTVERFAAQAFNLAMFVEHPTAQTIGPLITKASQNARNLAINAPVFEADVMAEIVQKAQRQAQGVATKVPEA